MQLKNIYNEPLELASLLVHVEMTYGEKDDEYISAQQLREQMCRQKEEHESLVKRKLMFQERGQQLDPREEHRMHELIREMHQFETMVWRGRGCEGGRCVPLTAEGMVCPAAHGQARRSQRQLGPSPHLDARARV